ncbi:PIN domain-like protein [Gigaspora margarita]|uniref:PIN domain-like protein n=1 Tax=Gigaspora margarita TaxID=4874 RepID=A0A8H4A2T3_GIGMA|nr:PIN domain-like protein [Gigaspora margarita]
MGIQCLIQALKSIHTNISIAKYAGRVVGVDAYCWLHKGIHTCITELAMNRPTTKYVDYCMRRVRMMKQYNVRPLIVFDGGFLPAKSITEVIREEKRKEYRMKGQELYKKGQIREAMTFLEKSIDITPEMALRDEDVEYVVAPYEADAQLAYLEKKNKIAAIITEDSDLLVFGCKTVIYKMDSNGNGIEISRDKFGQVQEINMLGWTDKQFRHMTMLSGCDYLPSIVGIGLKSAYKYVRKFKTAEKIIKLLMDGKMEVPPDYSYNFRRAELAFLYQRVFDIETKCLVTLNPIPEDLDINPDTNFIGPDLDSDVALGIAIGEINPLTKKPIINTLMIAENDSSKSRMRQKLKDISNGGIVSETAMGVDPFFQDLNVTNSNSSDNKKEMNTITDNIKTGAIEMLEKGITPTLAKLPSENIAGTDLEVLNQTQYGSAIVTKPKKRRLIESSESSQDNITAINGSESSSIHDTKLVVQNGDQKLFVTENLRRVSDGWKAKYIRTHKKFRKTID